MSDNDDHGTPIPLTIDTPPVAKVALPVGSVLPVWPRGQGAVMFNDTLGAIPDMPTVRQAKGVKFNENTLDAKPLKERE